MDYPKISVVILNWNTPEITIDCVKSVMLSDYQNIMINIIDNGSSEDNIAIFRNTFDKKVSLHKLDKNQGYVGGMNYGLKQASKEDSDYFLIMNNDTIIAEDAISRLVETAKKYQDNCVVTGKVYNYDDKNRLQTVGNSFNDVTLSSYRIGFNEIDLGQYEIESERQMIDDIFMLLPNKIYSETGGYNPYFFMNYEQTDLLIRIKKKGFKAIYTPQAKLWHKGSYSTGGIGNPYMMYWEGKSKIILHKLHQNKLHFFIFYLVNFWNSIYSLFKGIIGYLFSETKDLKSRYALFRGILSATLWLITKKPESGNNPFLKK